MKVAEIIDHFQIKGPITSIEPFGGGHINDTYFVKCQNSGGPDYLLQKVNSYVFKDIVGLMSNISIVTTHLRDKLISNKISDAASRSLELFKVKDGSLYFEDEDNQFWRVFNLIDDHKVYDGAPNTEIAFEGARMFGQFLNELSDLDPNGIAETIPNFHNIKFRLDNLEEAIKANPKGRVIEVKEQIGYVRSRYEIMSTIQRLGEKGLIPPRIVHNVTKINNVLFDQQNKGLCVIDLDTIMPGFVHYDFGDGVRTCANTGSEDDADLNNISYDLEMYKAFASGYIESVSSILNEAERSSLANAALLFPFIMGVRFLTDYIAGDVYYKINYENHNLVRAKAQLKLAADGESKISELERIVKRA
jgi:hypothetical protein